MRIVFIFLLGICMVHDLYDRRIPAIWLWLYFGTSAGYRLCMVILGKNSIKESLFCVLPGVILIIYSNVSRQVGSGDGWLIIAGGLYLKWRELIKVLYISFMAAGLFSVGYLLLVHKNRKDRIPFVPFLFLGTMILCGGEYF